MQNNSPLSKHSHSVSRIACRMAAVAVFLFLADSPTYAQEPSMAGRSPQYWHTDSGEYYSFDGVFYSFANQSGQGVKLWTPPARCPRGCPWARSIR